MEWEGFGERERTEKDRERLGARKRERAEEREEPPNWRSLEVSPETAVLLTPASR
jgi:hypothetical protein